MKTILAITFLLLCTTAAFVAPKKNPMEGTWKFVSGKYTYPDRVEQYDASQRKTIKIFTATHFSIVSMTADNQQFRRAAAGRLELKGNIYLEHVEYCSVPEQIGKTHRLEVRVEGDKYYQTGTLDDIKLEEVWQRVK